MVPALQAGWLAELLGVPLPDEPYATCGSCAMLPPPGERFTPGGAYFNPATKCCTFTPTLANFLVGRLLLDPDPALREGRGRVRARIQARAAALARHARDAASLGADAPALPAAVSLGTLSLTPTPDGLVRVTTHSPLDPLDLPRELVDLLPRLTGRPLGEARAALAAESGLELDDALLARLIDFEALRPVG